MPAVSITATVKSAVPRRYQRRLLDARVALRRRTDPRRPLPDFLVIGAQRGGTSSLYKWLESHPDVVASLRKETEFLSTGTARGEAWYRAHFPARVRHRVASARGRTLLTFEASPYYLQHPLAPARAAALVPGARLVALLRDPIDRAWSHHQHMTALGFEDLGFVDAVAAEPERLAGVDERLAADPTFVSKEHQRFCYLGRGEYAPQLERWLAAFDRSQLLVLRSEDLYADPAAAFARVLAHVGLAPHVPPAFRNHSRVRPGDTGVPPEVRAALAARVAPWNAATAAVVGEPMGWSA